MSKSKAKATTHSYRKWVCSCGKVCSGNGGKASHQRSCQTYKEGKLSSMEKTVERMKSEDYKGLSPATLKGLVEKWERDIKALRKDLA